MIKWDYPPDLPVIKTDTDKLRHILMNLINNAIKFTEKGAVTVSARVIDVSPFHGQGALLNCFGREFAGFKWSETTNNDLQFSRMGGPPLKRHSQETPWI